ncbi:MAG: dephospho-CoA kinase, partial [Chloroflexota bacterium]
MTVIGLTGGIASGKSTAAEYLRGLGATLIDADRVGHRSYEPGTPGFEKVVNAFGHEIVGKDGVIDRRILGGKVFGNPAEQERLQNIVWPEIRRLISEELRDIKRRDKNQIVVLEAAVLIEAGWTDLCDELWVVTTTQPIALQRLMSRNALSEGAALARIHAQAGTRERALAIADVKIDNSGPEEQMRQRLDRAWKTLTNRLADERGEKRPTRLPVKPVAKVAAKP